MRIGGFQKVSLIDFPGQISAVIFTQGCNFRCPYCHNPELVDPDLFKPPMDLGPILAYLDLRRGKIDGVTITGGEPTLHADLPELIRTTRELGYRIKLDTNGARPEVLRRLLEEGPLDYIAMDLKAPLEKYPGATCSEVDPESICESVNLVMSSGVDYEFRTTVLPSPTLEKDLLAMVQQIAGARRWVLQRFVPGRILAPNPALEHTLSEMEMRNLKEGFEKYVSHVMIRA
jgi:pyruvate formate lyase activating enzyme